MAINTETIPFGGNSLSSGSTPNGLEIFSEKNAYNYDTPPPIVRGSKEYSLRRTIKQATYLALGIAGVTLVTGSVMFFNDYNATLAPHVAYDNSVLAPGKASVEKISLDMIPITLATADTKVTGVEVAGGARLSTILGNIPLSKYTVTRGATVETDITVNPGKVSIEYNGLTGKLSYDVPDTALSTKVFIRPAEAGTIKTSSTLESLPLDMMAKFADAIGGTFGMDGSDVFGIGGTSDYAIKINNNLLSFADLVTTTSVDEVCTPKITKIPHFTERIQENIKTAVQGRILNPSTTDGGKNPGLSLLMAKSGDQIQKIVQDADVRMSSDYKIGPDKENIAKMKKFISNKQFVSSYDAKKISCGVSKDATLTLVPPGVKE